MFAILKIFLNVNLKFTGYQLDEGVLTSAKMEVFPLIF